MTSARKRVSHHQVAFSGIERSHLELGDCLMARGCSICAQAHGPVHPHPRHLKMPDAQAFWALHRKSIVAEWTARLDELDAPSFPCFGQVMFDGAPLPPVNPKWPEGAQWLHHLVAASVEGERRYGIEPPAH